MFGNEKQINLIAIIHGLNDSVVGYDISKLENKRSVEPKSWEMLEAHSLIIAKDFAVQLML